MHSHAARQSLTSQLEELALAARFMAPSCGGTGSTHLEPCEALAGGQQAQPVENDLQQRGVVLRQAGRGSRAGGVGDVWWQRRWHVLPWRNGATDQACSGLRDLHVNCTCHAALPAPQVGDRPKPSLPANDPPQTHRTCMSTASHSSCVASNASGPWAAASASASCMSNGFTASSSRCRSANMASALQGRAGWMGEVGGLGGWVTQGRAEGCDTSSAQRLWRQSRSHTNCTVECAAPLSKVCPPGGCPAVQRAVWVQLEVGVALDCLHSNRDGLVHPILHHPGVRLWARAGKWGSAAIRGPNNAHLRLTAGATASAAAEAHAVQPRLRLLALSSLPSSSPKCPYPARTASTSASSDLSWYHISSRSKARV